MFIKLPKKRIRFNSLPWLIILIGFAVVLVSPGRAHAIILIDTFDTDQSVFLDVLSSVDESFATAPEAIGGERDFQLIRFFGTGTASSDVNISTAGLLTYEVDSSTVTPLARLDIFWDGLDGSANDDPLGLGGLDLTESGSIDGILISAASDFGGEIEFLFFTDADSISFANLILPADPTLTLQDYWIPYSSFTQFGANPVDFTNIGEIIANLEVPNQLGGRIEIDHLQAGRNLSATVPEPASLFLLGSGFIGLARLSRKRCRSHKNK